MNKCEGYVNIKSLEDSQLRLIPRMELNLGAKAYTKKRRKMLLRKAMHAMILQQ